MSCSITCKKMFGYIYPNGELQKFLVDLKNDLWNMTPIWRVEFQGYLMLIIGVKLFTWVRHIQRDILVGRLKVPRLTESSIHLYGITVIPFRILILFATILFYPFDPYIGRRALWSDSPDSFFAVNIRDAKATPKKDRAMIGACDLEEVFRLTAHWLQFFY